MFSGLLILSELLALLGKPPLPFHFLSLPVNSHLSLALEGLDQSPGECGSRPGSPSTVPMLVSITHSPTMTSPMEGVSLCVCVPLWLSFLSVKTVFFSPVTIEPHSVPGS